MKPSGLADSPLFQKPGNGFPIKPDKPHQAPTHQSRSHAAMIPRYHDTMVEEIRKAVRSVGKEAATYRFTKSEKKALVEIIYSYRLRGIKLSENEITRIAINFITRDYKTNDNKSILNLVVKALNQ